VNASSGAEKFTARSRLAQVKRSQDKKVDTSIYSNLLYRLATKAHRLMQFTQQGRLGADRTGLRLLALVVLNLYAEGSS
jgi:hypothetical protein